MKNYTISHLILNAGASENPEVPAGTLYYQIQLLTVRDVIRCQVY